MRRLRAVAVFPTIFTLGNLVCGFFAIVVASRIAKPGEIAVVPSPRLDSARELFGSVDPTHNLMLCGALIFLAMIFDMFDGQVARMARVASDFGAQLDSLCDVVSFGVAPGILLVKMCPQFTQVHREAIWFIAALFACCAAMRLARFNVESDEDDDHTMFEGLPSPAAAAVIAGFAVLSYQLRNEINYADFQGFDHWLQLTLPPAAMVIGLLMVSRVPYPHFVNHLVRGQKTFPQLVGIVFAVMALLAVRWYAIPVACSLYALTPPLAHGWRWLWGHRHLMLRRTG
ncbi:MAG: CDP-diacylglycerol--serine O-phosphatidyltransferase [Pirellulales bacterium]|nr:CDP-diacylglycerol--serine O-phosphatidyltransferase [Pirellulales bacterium]